jgi:predicted nucleic acid-binding protein
MIKWFQEERESKNADAIRDDFSRREIALYVPSIYWWEMGNYFGRTMTEEGSSLLLKLLQINMKEVPMTLELAAIALEIMKNSPKESFYDASYHALAIHIGGTYITADEKYYKAAVKHRHIQLLKNYGKK